MHRYLMALGILLLIGGLSAINLVYPDGSELTVSSDSLRQMSTVRFNTTRSAEGEMANESWEGIPLLQLVENIHQAWDVLLISSKDGYQTTANRADLSPQSALLALTKGDTQLSDYDIRVIFPYGHESTWVRNIDKIKLEPLHTLTPRRFYPWQALAEACGKQSSEASELSFKDIAEKAYSLNKADFVFITADGSKLTFSYPKQLKAFSLFLSPSGKSAILKHINQDSTQSARELVFMQLGLLAYGDPTALEAIPGSLGWSGNTHISIIKGVEQSADMIKRGNLAPGSWIEFGR